MKKILLAVLSLLLVNAVDAQIVTTSPYSMYGLGQLADQSNGANKAMAGLSKGWREHNQVNFMNPASYSGIDSLSFIFDAGLSLQVTNSTEGTRRMNSYASSLDYVVGAFRLTKHVGFAFGVEPFSNVGYDYYNTQNVDPTTKTVSSSTTYTNTYDGEGGYHQVFVGLGVEPIKGFSIGANISYLWGSTTRSVINDYNDAYVSTLSKYYTTSVRAYKLDLGAQYQARLSKNDYLTLGATYSNGHKIKSSPTCQIISYNSQTAVSDTTTYTTGEDLALPTSWGAGFVYNHAGKIRVGFDFNMEKWSSLKTPVYEVVNNIPQYVMQSGSYMDRKKYTFGLDFCNNEMSRNYFSRVHCRLGVSYATPYYKINGQEGPKELVVSAGFGLPVQNAYNNRSVVNISAQWCRQEATGLIKENTFRINVGFTFNERWFAKWKVE